MNFFALFFLFFSFFFPLFLHSPFPSGPPPFSPLPSPPPFSVALLFFFHSVSFSRLVPEGARPAGSTGQLRETLLRVITSNLERSVFSFDTCTDMLQIFFRLLYNLAQPDSAYLNAKSSSSSSLFFFLRSQVAPRCTPFFLKRACCCCAYTHDFYRCENWYSSYQVEKSGERFLIFLGITWEFIYFIN